MPAIASHWLLLLCLMIGAAGIGVDAAGSVGSSPPTRSNFLHAAVNGGRRRHPSCSGDPGVCSDREKNPWGGDTCCFQRLCKDTLNDPDHCGGCGRRCAYGMLCCGGRCVDVRNDRDHCGSCYQVCPGTLGCSFAMCDYGS